ncbi:MAG: alpha-L-fucosidase, partial [bacterium]
MNLTILTTALCLTTQIHAIPGEQVVYKPTWESLDSRPIPTWFDDAKFGIFVVWGIYSVPAWSPKGQYAEWYWNNSLKEGSPTQEFHNGTYGKDFKYQDFVDDFTAELFDPDQWADIFARSGAGYV